jgi:hypothetical protein
MRVGRGVVVLAAVVVCLAMPIAPAAHAAGGTDLPFSSLFRIKVDGDHGLEFISGGPGTSDLVVLDVDGAIVTTIPMQGASGMVLIGSSLYVAEADAPEIAVVDTAASPPVVDHTIEVGSFSQPGDLTYVQGRLWFFTATGIATMLPDGSDLRGPFSIGTSYEPRFADGLTGGRDLIAFERGICSTAMQRYTATVPPVRRDWTFAPGGACNTGQMAVAPGGASLVIGAGAPYAYPEIRLTDRALLRSYVADTYPTAVTVTAAHGGMIAGGANGIYHEDIWAYRIGFTPSFFSYDFGTMTETVLQGGIAWSADGDRIFAVTSGPSARFSVILPTGLPTVQSSSLTVSASADVVPVGGTVDVTAHLEGGTTNHDVRVYSQPTQGTRTLIGAGTVDGAGDFTVTGVAPPESITLTAVYAGDDDWGSASTVIPVDVTSATTLHLRKSIGMDGVDHLYRSGDSVPIVGGVDPAVGGGKAKIIVQVNRGKGWRSAYSISVDYGDGGSFGSRYLATDNVGPRYRVKLRSFWTPSYLASVSTWQYYRFVKAGSA